jgi:SLT domain-containing protein
MAGGLAKGGTITGGTGELVPLAKGGIVQGGLGRALPMKGYANGGPIVDKPHIALIGEGKHNEAVVPLPDGRSIPVDMQGEGGANVTVQINAVDAKSVDLLFRERKDTLIDVIRQAISQSRSFRSAVGGA